MRLFQATLLAILIFCSLPASGDEGKIEITSDPPGAMVVVNHLIRGRTPLSLSLPDLKSEEYVLRVSHGEDFHPFSERLKFRPGQSEAHHVILAPRSETSLKQGVKYYKDGNSALAEHCLTRAVTDEPPQPEAYWWLAQLAQQQKQYEKALQLLREYAQYYPEKPEVHLSLGTLHRRLGNTSAALTSYKLGLLQSKDLSDSLVGIESVTWEAINSFGTPTVPSEQLRLAYMLELKGRIPEALEWAERAVVGAYPEYASGFDN